MSVTTVHASALRISDIDSKRMLIWVDQGKGNIPAAIRRNS